MKELKTLQDFKCYCELCAFGDKHTEEDILIKKKELKAEAVKWVKAFEKKNCTPPFKEFFNITEDDLK